MTTDIRKEVRICTVMYGGVSLAIYMNGIAREFYDLVRGRGMWGLLKLLSDTDITVDITSGTSAGGINGLYLSYALCNEREFAPLAKMWREKGGLKELLQKPDDENVKSLIDSAYMQEELQQAFGNMGGIDKTKEIAPTTTQKLDCFMAVTRFDGHTWDIRDFRNKSVTLKSYKGIIHFKHRKGRWEDFNFGRKDSHGEGVDTKTLSDVARATSSFPFAFEAQNLDGNTLDSKYWAGKSPLDKDEKAWFIDGGVLDNKPFGPALAEIYKRHASQPVDRLLFYVEPDPADKQDKAPDTEGPNVLETAVKALSGIPSYESIASDIDDLDQHNKRLDQYHAIFDPILESNRRRVSKTQWEIYNRARLYQLLALNEGLSKPNYDSKTSLSKKIQNLKDSFNNEGKETVEKDIAKKLNDLDIAFVIRAYYYWVYRLREKLNNAYNAKSKDDVKKISIHKTLLIRRLDMLLFLQGRLKEELKKNSGEEFAPEKLISTVKKVLGGSDSLINLARLEENEFGDLANLDGSFRKVEKKYTREFRDLYTAKDHIRNQESILPDFLNTLNKCVKECKELLSENATTLFQAIDAYQLPTLTLGDMGEFDRIEYYRISPLDTADNKEASKSLPVLGKWNTGQNASKEKVTGKQLGHFGAFLKKSWRANDIMWGRLDAATIIFDVLLRKHDLKLDSNFAAQIIFFYHAERIKLSGEVGNGKVKSFVEEHKESDSNADLREFNDRLEDKNQRQALFTYLTNNPKVLEALVRYADSELEHNLGRAMLQSHQSYILDAEIPNVIIAAFDEEIERQQTGGKNKAKQDDQDQEIDYKGAAKKVLKKFELDCQDPLLKKVAADSLSELITRNGADKPRQLKHFVSKYYDVGEEKIGDLDKLDTATTGLQAARIVFNLIKKIIPDDSAWGNKLETFVLNRLSIMITSLHLGVVSIRQGVFPYVWFFGVASSVLLLILRTFIGEADSWPIWPTLYIPSALLVIFLSMPKFWLKPKLLSKVLTVLIISLLAFVWFAQSFEVLQSSALIETLSTRLGDWWRLVILTWGLAWLLLWGIVWALFELAPLKKKRSQLRKEIKDLKRQKDALDKEREAKPQK